MDANRQSRSTLRSRRVMVTSSRARGRCASRLVFGLAEIFKKSPSAAGLQPVGRHVAKDMKEFVASQTPKTILRNHTTDHANRIHATRIDDASASAVASNAFDKNLTAQPALRTSKAMARKTNIWSGGNWMKSRPVESGLAREMQCDADV